MPVEFDQLKEFQKRINTAKTDVPELAKKCNKDIAAMFLSYTIDLTPVGKGTFDENGKRIKQGGTLRRGWTAQTHAEAASGKGNGKNPQSYVKTLNVEQYGEDYILDIINPVEYAIYVEEGHRQKKGQFVPALGKRLTGKVIPPRYMCRNGKNMTEGQVPKLIDLRIKQFMKEHGIE